MNVPNEVIEYFPDYTWYPPQAGYTSHQFTHYTITPTNYVRETQIVEHYGSSVTRWGNFAGIVFMLCVTAIIIMVL